MSIGRIHGTTRGFSFLEVMLVVVIIGILATIVAPKMLGRTAKARIAATKTAMKNVQTSLTAYDMVVGELPTTDQGLEALVRRPSDVAEEDWEQQMDTEPKDSWGQPFIYRCPGEGSREYDLFSMGKDKTEGTEDDVKLFEDEEE